MTVTVSVPSTIPHKAEIVPADELPQPVRRRSLTDISDDIDALDDLLDEIGGDVTDCEAAVTQWFAEIGAARDKKIDGYGSLIAEITNRAEIRQQRAAEMLALAESDKKKVTFLKQRLLEFFQLHGITQLHTERFRFTRCKNGGKQPMFCDEADRLPDEYRRQVIVYKPESEKIRAELECGKELGFARLLDRGEHIRIK